MGRLCGGAHEISGIKAPFFSPWVGGGGGVGGGWVFDWVGVVGWCGVGGSWGAWCAGEGCCGWLREGGW